MAITFRPLTRTEVAQVWSIDRREVIHHIYVTEARTRGARQMYVSATPSENTIHFYQRRGCLLAALPDPELFALEPEDIHLVCPV